MRSARSIDDGHFAGQAMATDDAQGVLPAVLARIRQWLLGSPKIETKKIFEPHDADQLLRGWLLHAHKGRDRHDLSARRCDRHRLWVGGSAAVLTAIVGTTVFKALESAKALEGAAHDSWLQLGVGAIAIVAAIMTSLSAFLGLSERAEKHRSAGVRYKTVIRDLERMISDPPDGSSNNNSVKKIDKNLVEKIQNQLDDLEATAPVVIERFYDRVEKEWKKKSVEFVSKACELYKLKASTPTSSQCSTSTP